MANAVFPGECTIITLNLLSYDRSKKIAFIDQMASIDVYESILNPLIVCKFKMNDGIGLYKSFPISGNELIELEYKTTGYDDITKLLLKVTSISNRSSTSMGRSVSYTITAVSNEIVKNNSTAIQKRYIDMAPEDIIQNILTNELKTDKRCYLEPCKGTQNFLVSQLKPLQVIDKVRLTSTSKEFQSSAFVFFENRTGFNFTTVENMFKLGKDAIGDKIFVMDSNINADISKSSFRNIIGYNHVTAGAPIGGIGGGSHYNKAVRVDLRTGTIDEKEFRLPDSEGDFQFADKDPVGLTNSTLQQDASTPQGTTLIYPMSSRFADNGRLESIGPRQSFVNLLTQNIVRICVFGDSLLSAGQVITLKIPTMTGLTGNEQTSQDDPLVSGNYMIGKIRHMIVNEVGALTYTCAIEALKGSYGESTV